MTALDRRDGIIDAAKDDARAAVDQLLDAIGRILLAHLDAHVSAAQPPTNPRLPHSAPARHWTPEEDALLRAHYPEGGRKGVQTAGVNRTATAIRERARRLNLTRSNYHWTPAEDAVIARHYPRGGLKAVRAAGLKRDGNAVYNRALRLGVNRDYANGEPPDPPEAPQTLTQRILATLVERDDADLLLDTDDLTPAEQAALRKLRRDKLATQDAPGLWRPTLGGLTAARNHTNHRRDT